MAVVVKSQIKTKKQTGCKKKKQSDRSIGFFLVVELSFD